MILGSTIGHYKIVAKLGEGGMGVVYKAEDTRLRRTVALKFLPRQSLDEEDVKARLIREAQAAAGLDHPNICQVFGIHEEDGEAFIAMAFIEGPSLAEKIKERPLPLDEATGIATQIAEALQEAHEQGVVHRDIKPQNILLTGKGQVKILDFGLAAVSGLSKLTKTGTTLGTPAYMAPEQLEGKEVDRRADVWALGCVFYEMLTQRSPFAADYEQAIGYGILNEDPEPISAQRGDVSPAIDRLITKALAKRPDERYQHADDLLTDLRALQRQSSPERKTPPRASTAGAVPTDVPRVAVLPLKTRAGDGEMESFADGLTEEITSGLSQFRHLIVVSAGTASGLQNKSDPGEASGELGARFLLEGRIRKAGSSIRVSMKLLDAVTGAHLWAERFDRDLDSTDVFAAQDELTDRIVATVADPFGVLTRSLAAQVEARPTGARTAHEAVLRTFGYWQQVRPDEQAEVRTALEQALEREPYHAEALACLARLFVDEHRFNFNPPADALERALHAAQRAVEANATSQLAYRSLAEAHFYRRELSAFRVAADRALALNPRDTANVHWMGMLIAYSGDWATGHPIAQKVKQLNPHHPSWFYFFYATYHYHEREYEQAIAAAEKVNMPGYYFVNVELAMANAQLGRIEEARIHLKKILELAPDFARDAREDISKWWGFSEDFVEHRLQGLRKAGLEVDGGK